MRKDRDNSYNVTVSMCPGVCRVSKKYVARFLLRVTLFADHTPSLRVLSDLANGKKERRMTSVFLAILERAKNIPRVVCHSTLMVICIVREKYPMSQMVCDG